MAKKHTIDECHKFAENKGGKCISEIYHNVSTLMLWQCKENHSIWSARFGDILKGHWCPECVGLAKIKIEYIRKFVENKNGELITKKCINSNSILKIKCKKDGKIWKTKWSKLKQGCWCPRCSRKEKPVLQDIKKFVENKDGVLLIKKYKNCYSPLKIQCNKDGCIWYPCWNNIQNGHWCPECSLSKTQKILFNIIKDLFPNNIVNNNYTKFNWLKSKNKYSQEIDIYVEKIKLAIEYDGKQHFEPVKWFGGEEQLKYTKKMDKLKNRKIAQHPEDVAYFIRFNYKENKFLTKEYVKAKLIEKGVKV